MPLHEPNAVNAYAVFSYEPKNNNQYLQKKEWSKQFPGDLNL